VSAPGGDAVKYAGPDPSDKTITVLPDGRRVQAAGAEWLFDEADLVGGGPSNVLAVPSTKWLLVVDTGYGTHSIRVVDQTKMGGTTSPVASYVAFPAPQTLNTGIAFVAPDLVLVATDDGVVQALKLDTTAGALTKDDARSIMLPASVDDLKNAAPYYVGGLAVSPDAKKLVVTSVFDTRALVFDLSSGNYGKQLGAADIGDGGSFMATFDPNDATGHFVYASRWAGHAVVEIDVSNPAAPKAGRTFKMIDKNPEGIAFLDGRWMAIANSYGDTIVLVDRTTGTMTSVPVDTKQPLHGEEPSTLAYDSVNKRLYATLAGANAVAAWAVDASQTPPALTPAGHVPTSWWPSSVAVLPSGTLAVTALKGHSDGPLLKQFVPDDGDSQFGVRGAIQLVPAPSALDLTAGETKVRAFDNVAGLAGASAVTCPNGENDFPLPATNTAGPSKQIQHVIFILRENKTFDGVFGDLPGANGDPTITLKKTTADMDKLWTNFRKLARTFATSDNYYTDAELSDQGHTWMTYGRSSDFTERTWHLNGGYTRYPWKTPIQPSGTADIGEPIEGSIFQWLVANKINFDVLGEGEGSRELTVQSNGTNPIDVHYPGGFVQSIGYPDVEKACYVAGRMRVLCDLNPFVFMTFPNDHTQGVSMKQASPETMIAVNDEATGMLIDALSHSPLWASSLVVVTEDDPAGGGDHVDHHRTPVLLVSPWIKRGYVSKTHFDVSSLHKMLAHIYGIPYAHALVANAALPFDVFSSTPDYTPFTYVPREWQATCGVAATNAEQRLTDSWDMSEVDEQPGLGAQVWRWSRGQQYEQLPPAIERAIELRNRQRAAAAP
jgi:DNA-binding beta-propeller fold protein YncE